MAKFSVVELYHIIKQDDLASFIHLAEDKKNLLQISLGRFPILSVCYLYKAKKIIKQYESKLLQIDNYNIADEPYQLSNDFVKVAGKSLRMYTNDTIVSPLEMLAILGRDGVLKKKYLNTKTNDGIESRLRSHYEKINDRNFVFESNKIKISRKPLSRYVKNLMFKTVLVCLSFIIAFVGCGVAYIGVYGDGLIKDVKVYNQKQLMLALERNSGKYIMENDIVIEDGCSIADFGGVLDGGGNTLVLRGATSSLIDNLQGTISNITIKVESKAFGGTGSRAVLADVNNGIINNVNVIINGELSMQYSDTECTYFGGLVVDNYGEINNSHVNININAVTGGGGESFVCGVAGRNYGTITNCSTKDGSIINTENIDIAGIVADNKSGGKVINCTNNANLSQKTNIDEWSPICSGVVAINYGLVSKSANNGNCCVVSEVGDNERQTAINVGGVVGINYSLVEWCLNKAQVTAESVGQNLYVGGVCGTIATTRIEQVEHVGKVSDCGNYGQVDVEIGVDNCYGFCGGIVGFGEGVVERCFAVGGYTQESLNGKYYFGGIVGGCYVQTFQFGDQVMITNYSLTVANNCYLVCDEILCGVGGFVSKYGVIYFNDGIHLDGVIACNTIDEIIDKGVYYEEQN